MYKQVSVDVLVKNFQNNLSITVGTGLYGIFKIDGFIVTNFCGLELTSLSQNSQLYLQNTDSVATLEL